MHYWVFRISLLDLAILAAIITGLLFGSLLLLAPRLHHRANRLLGLAVLVMVLWLCWVLGIDLWLQRYSPH